MRIPSIAALTASLLVAGCAATPLPEILPHFNPANPATGLRDARYSPVLGDYQPRRPTGPDGWRKLNDELSPARKGQGS
ncbi:MAG: hypothetical protein M9939_07750 [Mesorhizobium sp.]|nr:hypothetical protein [Mesorhizobium sp.]MCO5161014.1 hypothetical protein [Mesorhizobium sp.]